MKRLLCFLMTTVILMSSLAGCSGGGIDSSNSGNAVDSSTTAAQGQTGESAAANLEPHMIAILFSSLGTQENEMKTYLSDHIGPAFNTKFIYSEICDSAEKSIAFIESAYSAGAEAVISYSPDAEIVTAKCAELEMYVAHQSNIPKGMDLSSDYLVGFIGSGVRETAELFSEIVKDFASDGEEHNVIIVSGGAGMGTQQHKETAIAILETLQEIYGLTYEEEIETLATATAITEVKTGTDIKILIYPGFAGSNTYVSEMSSILQTGEYDVVLSVYQAYTQFSVAIDEVEKNFGFNIKVGARAPLAEATKNGFDTADSTGDTSLNAAVVAPNSYIALLFALTYNAVTGNAEFLKVDGEAIKYESKMWVALNAEEFNEMMAIDRDDTTYSYTADDLKLIIKKLDPELTRDQFNEMVEQSDVDSVKARRNMK